MNAKIEVYDTTLRDGSQRAGISFSLHDKLTVAQMLDRLGVHFIELGWPGANEKDSEAFQAVKDIQFRTARIVAFGMTCGKGKKPEDDKQLSKLLAAETDFIAVVGKSSKIQVFNVLETTLQENLRLIEESCRFLAAQRRTVFFGAEHFFDGYKTDSAYALDCLKASVAGGASRVVLCDTNGGSFPWEIAQVIETVRRNVKIPVGIHAHNDGGLAVINTLEAVRAGADQVHVTINGYGERCGNADICSVVPNLQLKMGFSCLSEESMTQLTETSRHISELANLLPDHHQPFVGKSAFCHKGGLHVSAILRDPNSYQHIKPEMIGNTSCVAVSELSGRSNIVAKAREFGISLTQDQVKKVLARVEQLENIGFQFEGADGSLKLEMMRHLENYQRPFEILRRTVISERINGASPVDSATVKVAVGGEERYEVSEGNGPFDALANALLKTLLSHFPHLRDIRLVDHKSRVVGEKKGTAKAVRILIDFSDGQKEWTTVGCSTDSLEANLQALTDGFEYAILMAR